LEHALAEWKQAEAALVFSSGFAANYGVISTLSAQGVTVLSDELNHASLIDGCRAGRGEVSVFRHNDLDEVAARLAAAPGRVMVVTESVFSMDGDLAPLTELSVLCAAHRALLVIDDAHGVLGSPPVVPDATVLWLGTLSKTLASQGGYVAGPAPIVDLIVNRARSFIFSTGLSPADAAAASAALGVFTSDSGSALRRYLAAAVERVAPGHRSPIIPVVLGSEHAALAASRRLLDAGLLVPAIRPPTVPPGTSRLRIALSAAHTSEMIDRLLSGLAEVSRAA
jgi:7-keto-8-aminopelargonate synthetase-like enzyme